MKILMKKINIILAALTLTLFAIATASCEKEKPQPQPDKPQKVLLAGTQWEGMWEYSRTTGGTEHHFRQEQDLSFENDSSGLFVSSSFLDGQHLYTDTNDFDYTFDGVSSGLLLLHIVYGSSSSTEDYEIYYDTPSQSLWLINEVGAQNDTLVFTRK